MENEELRIAEAAKRLGVSQRTLRYWSDKGLVAHRRLLSGQRRFDPAEIERVSLKMMMPEAVLNDEPAPEEEEESS
jgi:excisionase family DNA binding protein